MGTSQHELSGIDALLRAVGDGRSVTGSTPATRGVLPYDFRRPSRFSKDHLRALQTIHERFGRNLVSALTSYLRLNVRAQLATVEQVTFDEYVQQLPSPTIAYILRMPPLEGPAVLELSLAPTLAMLDRLCGGQGAVANRDRELTEIEQALLRPIGRHLVHAMTDGWNGVVEIKPAVEDILLNARGVRTAGPNEIVVLLRLEFVVGDVAGSMSICLPHVALEPIMDRLHSQAWLTEPGHTATAGAETALLAQLAGVPLDVTVELGQVELSASTLLALCEGDVIRLGTAAQGDLVLRVADRPMLRCRPGLSAGNVAVQISS